MKGTKIAAIAVAAAFVLTALAVPIFSVDSNGGSSASEINDYIRGITYYPDADIAAHYGCTDKTVDFEDGDGYAITIKYTKMEASANGSQVLSNNSNVETKAYPGSILVGDKYLADNNPNKVLTEDRANITLSTTLPISKEKSAMSNPQKITVNPKEYGDVSNAIVQLNDRWKQYGDTVAAQLNYEETEAHNATQIAVSLDVSIPQLAELGINASWEKNTDETTYVVNFTQVFYTVAASLSPDPSDYFGPNTTKATLENQLKNKSEGRTYQGVIVSSVTYGRTVIASISVKDTSEDAKIALQAAISGTEESLTVEQQETLSSSTVKYYIYGGESPTKTLSTMDDIREYLNNTEITDENINTAKPIQYCTNWIDYGSQAKNNSTSEYMQETITETKDIKFSFDFTGGYTGRYTLKYTAYDSIAEDGTYVNKHDVEKKSSIYYCQTHDSTVIDAKHLSTMYLTVEAVSCTDPGPIKDYKIYPLESIYYDQGGTACDQTFTLKIDGVQII